MIKKITIEITEEKAITRLLDEKGRELNRKETVPTETGTTETFENGDFEEMGQEEGMTDELWEALEQNFFAHDILTAMNE